MENEQQRLTALFRYGLIFDALDEEMSSAQRGRLVRHLAGREHQRLDGTWVGVGRSTVDRWIREYRAGGFDALVPKARRYQPRSDVQLLDLAVRLKRENPARTAAHIYQMVVTDLSARQEQDRKVPSARTLQRHFARLGLNLRPDGQPPQAYGRFEAAKVNDLWVGDVAHGPQVAGRKALLFAFMDDHSRLVVGSRWGHREDVLRLEAALRRGLAARGVPRRLYVDNGSPFVSAQLQRACAVLGMRLVHSRPGRPEGRGKIERFFATVRAQFLVEIADDQLSSLDELNRLFTAWLETRYHHAVHRETDMSPLERFTTHGMPALPSAALLREAFLWSEIRHVTKTALVSLHGNQYEVDTALVGLKVQLVFDPFDMTQIEVRYNNQGFGHALPHQLRTHVHPKASSERAGLLDDMPSGPSNINYLELVEAEHEQASNQPINFHDLDRDLDQLHYRHHHHDDDDEGEPTGLVLR